MTARALETEIRERHEQGALDYTRANGAARFISRAPIAPMRHACDAGSGYFALAAQTVRGDTIDAIYRALIDHFEAPRLVACAQHSGVSAHADCTCREIRLTRSIAPDTGAKEIRDAM